MPGFSSIPPDRRCISSQRDGPERLLPRIPLYTRTRSIRTALSSCRCARIDAAVRAPQVRDVAGTVGSSMPLSRGPLSEPSANRCRKAAARGALETAAARSAAPAAEAIAPPAAPAPAVGNHGEHYPEPRRRAAPAARPRGPTRCSSTSTAALVSEGRAAPLTRTQVVRVGEHHGFAVYALPGADPAEIFIPVSKDADDFVARYVRRPAR